MNKLSFAGGCEVRANIFRGAEVENDGNNYDLDDDNIDRKCTNRQIYFNDLRTVLLQ